MEWEKKLNHQTQIHTKIIIISKTWPIDNKVLNNNNWTMVNYYYDII